MKVVFFSNEVDATCKKNDSKLIKKKETGHNLGPNLKKYA